MDIQAELKHMSDEIFHEELSKKMLDASLQEMEEDDFLIPEDEYNEGVAELTKIFRDDQRAKFDQMEELCKQNIMYLIKFAFGGACTRRSSSTLSNSPGGALPQTGRRTDPPVPRNDAVLRIL